MNTILKAGVASALALGAVAAHASISSPDSGSSDAILFAEVVNSTSGAVVASYAGDTGVSISSLGAGLSGSTTVLGSDSNLAALFAANTSGNTIVWAVEGGQYTGNNNTTNFQVAGHAQFVTTSVGDATNKLAVENTANLTHWAGLTTDVATINSNSGGANSVEGSAAAAAGVWDAATPTGTAGWYSNGPVTANTIGGAQKLFFVTGGGTAAAKVAYTNPNGETASLSASGLTFAVSGTSPVPVPAAVWLFGSGLLGLTGIARRKSKA